MITSDIGRFGIVPEWLFDSGVSAQAIAIYALLAIHADREADECFPSLAYIASRIGCSADTVRRKLRELESAGAIIIAQRHDDTGRQESNIYTVCHAPMQGGRVAPMQGGDGTHARGEGCTRATPLTINSINQNPSFPSGKEEIHKRAREEIIAAKRPRAEVTYTAEVNAILAKQKRVREAFTPPTREECAAYFAELGAGADEAEAFYDHFDNRLTKRWHLSAGKGPLMRDWRIAAKNWHRNQPHYRRAGPPKRKFSDVLRGIGIEPEEGVDDE